MIVSLRIMINVSTKSCIILIPFIACSKRWLPSLTDGVVRIAISGMLSVLIICAMTGVAPVPVPPPIPAVIKIKSGWCCLTYSRIIGSDSLALAFPTSASFPAPLPSPIHIFCVSPRGLLSSALLSVLQIIRFTPLILKV